MAGPVFRLSDVSKRYDGKLALAPTTIDIEAQRRLALIGPSGCGKSTLLRIVLGLIPPDTGSVSFHDIPVTPENARRIRERVGYVIQDGGLFPHLTVGENVALKARDLGWPEKKIADRLLELAELARFPGDLMSRYPVQLSGGQRQRVGLMRALMLDPEVLLMDEPLGALDPIVRSRLQEDLREIFVRLGKTVVIVTHDMGEAAYLGDEIAIVKEGRILQRGTLRDLLDRPADPFVVEFMRAQRVIEGAIGGAIET